MLPESWTLIPVTAKFQHFDGRPPRGAVHFAARQVVVVDGVTVVPRTITVHLDPAGELATELPATMDPAHGQHREPVHRGSLTCAP